MTKATIDPAENGGDRAEVSVKGISGGIKMGHGPGAAADGDFSADIEIRYAMGHGDFGAFDASMLRQGSNTRTLTVPAGNINNGVLYDYLRLELADARKSAP